MRGRGKEEERKMPKNKTQGIIFGIIMSYAMLGGAPVWQLPAIWVGTFIKNFPMAFFWNMFAAAPFTHWVSGKLFK